ncbi:hypothetical protein pb186bvf_009997 [Paramecium bursaria]
MVGFKKNMTSVDDQLVFNYAYLQLTGRRVCWIQNSFKKVYDIDFKLRHLGASALDEGPYILIYHLQSFLELWAIREFQFHMKNVLKVALLKSR